MCFNVDLGVLEVGNSDLAVVEDGSRDQRNECEAKDGQPQKRRHGSMTSFREITVQDEATPRSACQTQL